MTSTGVSIGPAPTTVHLTPVGDDLQYRSDSEESGRPQAPAFPSGS